MLYIVLAESGEYSDRWVWVAAVYHTEAEARAAMQAAIERRGVWEAWDNERDRMRLIVARKMGIDLLTMWRQPDSYEEFKKVFASRLPPEPPKEHGERFQIVEIKPGKWAPGYDEFDGWVGV